MIHDIHSNFANSLNNIKSLFLLFSLEVVDEGLLRRFFHPLRHGPALNFSNELAVITIELLKFGDVAIGFEEGLAEVPRFLGHIAPYHLLSAKDEIISELLMDLLELFEFSG